MPITFFTQSRKEYGKVYIRIREGGNPNNKGIDAKTKTNISVEVNRFNRGNLLKYKKDQKDSHIVKAEKQSKNESLDEAKRLMGDLERDIRNKLNNRKPYEVINTKWLKNAVKPVNEAYSLSEYFEVFMEVKKNEVAEKTYLRLEALEKSIKEFEEKTNEKIYLSKINQEQVDRIKLYFKDYNQSTIYSIISGIKQICKFAFERGKEVHPTYINITKGLSKGTSHHVYLTFNDIEELKSLELQDEREDWARDWLLISCSTAQRVGDYLKFNKKNITTIEDIKVLRVKQTKVKKSKLVYIPLDDTVLNILDKYKGNFPPSFSDNERSSITIYNRIVKRVCKKAKLNELITVNKRHTKVSISREAKVHKWEAVSSHTGRRSYATNYYGQMPTSLLKDITNHSTEAMFLEYVGEKPEQNVLELAEHIKRIAQKNKNK